MSAQRAVAPVERARSLAAIIGVDELAEIERTYLEFGDRFERELLQQDERRSLEDTLSMAWRVLSVLPRNELTSIRPELLDRYRP